jgi:hypothetical protein
MSADSPLAPGLGHTRGVSMIEGEVEVLEMETR